MAPQSLLHPNKGHEPSTDWVRKKLNSFASSSINPELSAYTVVVGHYGELRCHGVSSWEPACD